MDFAEGSFLILASFCYVFIVRNIPNNEYVTEAG